MNRPEQRPVEESVLRGSESVGFALIISRNSILYSIRLRLSRYMRDIGIRNTVFG